MVNKSQPQFQTPQRLHQEESDEELSDSVTESPALDPLHLPIRPGSALSRGLSLHIQKQLAADIEADGGLSAFSLKKLCNRKADIYGETFSNRRRQVQNKVFKWKQLEPVEYACLLTQLKVHSALPTSLHFAARTLSTSGVSSPPPNHVFLSPTTAVKQSPTANTVPTTTPSTMSVKKVLLTSFQSNDYGVLKLCFLSRSLCLLIFICFCTCFSLLTCLFFCSLSRSD
jgi:hypothetical protein